MFKRNSRSRLWLHVAVVFAALWPIVHDWLASWPVIEATAIEIPVAIALFAALGIVERRWR